MGVFVFSSVLSSQPESAPVTDWPTRLLLMGIMIAILAIIFYLMRARWRRLTSESERGLPRINEVPTDSVLNTEPIPGVFLGTSPSGDWMRRVMAQGLGVRSRASLQWDNSGIFIERTGEADLFVGTPDIVGCEFGRGVAGTVRAKGSVLVITWKLGEAILDSGFRADNAIGHHILKDQCARLVEGMKNNQ
jgi:hypothetical protein